MKCSLCGCEFDADKAAQACKGCATAASCGRMIRCPNCGFATPREPVWLKALSRLFEKRRNRATDD